MFSSQVQTMTSSSQFKNIQTQLGFSLSGTSLNRTKNAVDLSKMQINIFVCFIASSVQVCSRNDRNLANCIIRSVKLLQPALASGNLGGGFQIPSIEPFYLEK